MSDLLSRRIDDILAIEEIPPSSGQDDGSRLYRGQPHHHTDRDGAVLYGGLLLGQAAQAIQAHAASCFGADKHLHSLRAYFLHRARIHTGIDYQVSTLRQGRGFCLSSLSARQDGKNLLDFGASFHAGEAGFAHQASMPQINPPDDDDAVCPMDTDLRNITIGDSATPIRFSMPLPAKIDISNSRAFVKDGQAHLYCWMRALEPVADNRAAAVSALAYLSDYVTMATVVYPHDPNRETDLFVVSLDHSMWIYRRPQVHEWHLYEMTSPISADGRGLSLGKIYSREGELWAAFCQEGLLRHNPAK